MSAGKQELRRDAIALLCFAVPYLAIGLGTLAFFYGFAVIVFRNAFEVELPHF